MLYYMPFLTADALTVNTNWNVTVPYCLFGGVDSIYPAGVGLTEFLS